MTTITVPDEQLLELVACAVVADEVESPYDLEVLRSWPSPVPEMVSFVLTFWRDEYRAPTFAEFATATS
ncbi:hypothetical protein C5B97_11670 [Pseudoclavibacter sp. RFBB5]|nr:hypothetical protein C5B97_11670 [Pseudoclavibacter sp. RFBB5]